MQVVRKIIFLLAILVINPGVVLAHVGGESETVIHVTDDGFSPKEVSIKQEGTVIFENVGKNPHWPASNTHPTHQIYPDFDTKGPIKPSQTWSFTFNKSGEWGIHDHLYPQYKGKIVVGSQGSVLSQRDEEEKEKQSRGLFGRIVKVFNNLFIKILSFLPESLIISEAEREDAISGYSTEFIQPQDARSDVVHRELEFNCDSTDYACISNALRRETDKYGPQAVLDVFKLLLEERQVSKSVDEHQLAHEIGRQTAKSFGVNSQAFLLCPMTSFNGGCQHGFFEYVLGRTDTETQAADIICKSLDESYSSKFRSYCYHGVGHGVLMAKAYDLDTALGACDSFDSFMAQDGCWQGVFMENTNAGMRGEARFGVFSKQDTLAPCNKLEYKYKHECYINHAGWLMVVFGNDVQKATRACLQADSGHIASCLQSIGLMITNPVWQEPLSKGSYNGNFEQIAWQLCLKFPREYIAECIVAGVDNILNFDSPDISRSAEFCSVVDAGYQNLCYQRIGITLVNQVTDSNLILEKCASLEGEFSLDCRRGARL